MADSAFKINRGVTLNPQTSAPANPTNGDIYYDSTLGTFVFYNNSQWVNLSSKTDVASATSLTSAQFTSTVVQGSLINITGSNTSTLHGLTASSNGKQILIYNGSTNALLVSYNSGTEPTSSGKILTFNSGDATIQSGQSVLLVYNSSIFSGAGGWILASSPGSGSGSGVGDDLGSLLFRASFTDNFDEGLVSSLSGVASSNGSYSASKTLYRLSYDAAKTVAGGTTTTNLNISAVAAFTVAIGDVAIYGSEVKRITAVASQSSFTTEAFSVAPTVAGQVTISQAVHSKDVYGTAFDGSALSAAFPGVSFSDIMVDYEDTTTLDDNIFDVNVAPVIAYTASPDNSSWTSLQVRPTLESVQITSVALPSAGTALYFRFFANKISGTGAVNILRYKAFMQKDSISASGGVLNSSYAFTDGVGTPVNCSLSVVGGKTVVTLTYSYALGVNSGSPYGSIDVYLNGQMIPRFINATLTPDGSYLEYSSVAIQLDQDYSTQNLSVEVLQRTQIVDASTVNTTNISNLQSSMQSGFQGFVNQSNLLTPTLTTGSPVAGTFYSSIIGRSSIVDLSQDLKPRMGIERISTQQIYQLQSEFGSSGEAVHALANDSTGLVRFVGEWVRDFGLNNNGPLIISSTLNNYIEVTFYGTGLNLLWLSLGGRDIRASVDGGAEGGNLVSGSFSTVLGSRFYSTNQVVPVVGSLALGVHTVKLRIAVADSYSIYGLEILNESSSVKTNPGISYLDGKKLALTTQSSVLYSTSVTGTRGGRMLVYQGSDGSISRAFQAVDASAAYIASANHSNEEVARTYHWREFGASRADDFSKFSGTSGLLAHQLDDGTTSLFTNGIYTLGSYDSGFICNTINNYFTITFVGTGLDVVEAGGGAVDPHSVTIDGTNVGSIPSPAIIGTRKIVSGLPYGTHNIRILRTASATGAIAFKQFIVYQPKKPTLPSGAIELADFNVMADYTAPVSIGYTAGLWNVAGGVLRKSPGRELTYRGSGWSLALDESRIAGFNLSGVAASDSFEYTFFGTGFDLRFIIHNGGASASTCLIDGSSNFSAFTTSVYGTGATFTAATGVLDQADATTSHGGLVVSGLSMGVHTFKCTQPGATTLIPEAFDVITPIHSMKSNLPADVQNTLSIGSQGISDNRKITPVKEALSSQKAWAQAAGFSSTITTTSATLIPLPDMSVTIKTSGGDLKIESSVLMQNTSANQNSFIAVFVDGENVNANSGGFYMSPGGAGSALVSTMSYATRLPVAAGVHKVDLYWSNGAGTAQCPGNGRLLLVEEV